ncbi:MAG: protease SohB [Buchnera aphidicola (Floraphis choui)]
MNLILNYILFLSKIFTIFLFISLTFFIILNITRKKNKEKFKLDVISLNDHYKSLKNQVIFSKLSKYEKKIWNKKYKKIEKEQLKNNVALIKKNNYCLFNKIQPTLYVLDFKGSINAKEVDSLREEISAIILVFRKHDEVLLRLESGGGTINGYGLAAAQLQRLKDKNIYLTISIDKLAASGGYMMACVANHIIGSSFSIIGSIGVVAQIPNFHKFLKKHDIDVELHTAGNYKRTLTIFGKNTSESREKFCSELNFTHTLFKEFVYNMRPSLNIEEVSNGEYWFGSIALKKGLIDSINTSDNFILSKINKFSILRIKYTSDQTMLSSFFLKVKKFLKMQFSNF